MFRNRISERRAHLPLTPIGQRAGSTPGKSCAPESGSHLEQHGLMRVGEREQEAHTQLLRRSRADLEQLRRIGSQGPGQLRALERAADPSISRPGGEQQPELDWPTSSARRCGPEQAHSCCSRIGSPSRGPNADTGIKRARVEQLLGTIEDGLAPWRCARSWLHGAAFSRCRGITDLEAFLAQRLGTSAATARSISTVPAGGRSWRFRPRKTSRSHQCMR